MSNFESFSSHHVAALAVFALFTLLVIWFGLNINDRRKLWIGFGIASIALAIMVFDSIYRLATNTYDLMKDLPFFLCDLVVIILPFVIWTQNRKWIGILYFWVVAGTLQALITPELEEGFPQFEFFRYFIMHGGIVTAVIYYIVVFKININWRDFWNAILYIQCYLLAVHLINILLKSNYSYTVKKPSSTTILDYMGNWPWYILLGEVLMILLFLILMVPFIRNSRHKSDSGMNISQNKQEELIHRKM